MRAVVIGGSGHIGGYLVPRLVEAGHDVVVVSRGRRLPYRPHDAWRKVTMVTADRGREDAQGAFGQRIAALEPDLVIDLICFDLDSARQLVGALRGRVRHFLHCGSIWVHGSQTRRPTGEDQPRHPIDDYGRRKAAVEAYLLEQAERNGFPATVVHPGHITGPGWVPVNPVGNVNPTVFRALASGTELAVPNLGMETVQHVHADDVARLFMAAIAHPSVAVGESFHAVADTALALRDYAEAVASWYGQRPHLVYLRWERWAATVSPEDARISYDHLAHSPRMSNDKARRLLGCQPRYACLEAVSEALDWLTATRHPAAPR